MPCTEPTAVRAPTMDRVALASLLVSGLRASSRNRQCAPHYVIPCKQPVAVIALKHPNRLQRARDTAATNVAAALTLLGDFQSQFEACCGALTGNQKDFVTPGIDALSYEGAVKNGLGVDCAEFNIPWRRLARTSNEIMLCQARMISAVETARECYALRLLCPPDPCDDDERAEWRLDDCGGFTPEFVSGEFDAGTDVAKLRADLDAWEKRAGEVQQKLDETSSALEKCQRQLDELTPSESKEPQEGKGKKSSR